MKKYAKSHEQNNHYSKYLSVIKAQEAISEISSNKIVALKIVPTPISSNPQEIPSYTLEEEDVALCEQYHIPYQKSYSTYKELSEIEELIGDYLDLLAGAKSRGITWDNSTFDPEGLRAAIDEYYRMEDDEELSHAYHKEMKSNLWDYYSSLGVL